MFSAKEQIIFLEKIKYQAQKRKLIEVLDIM